MNEIRPVSVRDAEEAIRHAMFLAPRETCLLVEAPGRILREELKADRDLPPFDRVAMDGIALSFSAWESGIRDFAVEGIQAAGQPALSLANTMGGCLEVMTGAVLPPGCDCVIPVEQILFRDNRAYILEISPRALPKPWRNVHRKGTDCLSGATLASSGSHLSPAAIGIAASVGKTSLWVSAQPSLAVVSTGDELVEVGTIPLAHQIRRSNSHALEAGLNLAGFRRTRSVHLPDNRRTLETELETLIAENDGIILSGGVSMGKFDFIPEVLARLGVEKLFHKVAQKPGKPFWFGVMKGNQRRKPVFALPGNPVSALVCFYRYVLPALRFSQGLTSETSGTVVPFAELAAPVRLSGSLTLFCPVTIQFTREAKLVATPIAWNGSGDYGSLGGADGFLELDPSLIAKRSGADPANFSGEAFPAGFSAPFFAWRL